MEINRAELKRQAREYMSHTDPKFWVVALAYIAMTTGVSWLFSFLPIPHTQTSQLFFRLLLSLYTVVVQFGMCLWALWTWRQLNPGINSLMQGFSVAGRVLLMELGIYIRILGWYFMAAFILAMPVFLLVVGNGNASLGMFSMVIFIGGLLATLIILELRYALAPYLLADRPDDGPTIPILRSAALMRGWKRELFGLELSFIGWELLNILLTTAVYLFFLHQAGLLTGAALLTPGWQEQMLAVICSPPAVILSSLVTIPVYLWLYPYRAIARAGFYDARLLLSEREDRLPEMPPL